jgi:chromosome segregation ATPase
VKKKIIIPLQENHENTPSLRAGVYFPHLSVNMDELFRKQEQLSKLLTQKEEAANQKEEVESRLREIQKKYAHMELTHQEKLEFLQQELEQIDVSMHGVNQQSEANYEHIKSIQEKLDDMISELNETKHQFMLSKNDLQSCLKTFHDTNIRMNKMEKNLSKVTGYFNEQKKEKRKEKKQELPIRKTNKEATWKDKEV